MEKYLIKKYKRSNEKYNIFIINMKINFEIFKTTFLILIFISFFGYNYYLLKKIIDIGIIWIR